MRGRAAARGLLFVLPRDSSGFIGVDDGLCLVPLALDPWPPTGPPRTSWFAAAAVVMAMVDPSDEVNIGMAWHGDIIW